MLWNNIPRLGYSALVLQVWHDEKVRSVVLKRPFCGWHLGDSSSIMKVIPRNSCSFGGQDFYLDGTIFSTEGGIVGSKGGWEKFHL